MLHVDKNESEFFGKNQPRQGLGSSQFETQRLAQRILGVWLLCFMDVSISTQKG